MRGAKATVSDYATPFGLHVERVLRISERSASTDSGQDIIVSAMQRGAATPLLPGEQEVTADVWIDYALTR